MADPSYINSQSVDWDKFYSGIVPQKTTTRRPTSAQMQAIREVGPNSLDRLPTGSAGLPAPAGSGMTPSQVSALGGWSVDPRTGQFAYAAPGAQTPAAAAAGQVAQSVPLPRPRPANAPTRMDIAAWMAANGANPGMGGAMIGNGEMAPGIAPQGPPPDGIAPTNWGGSKPAAGSPAVSAALVNRMTTERAMAPNGYIYGRSGEGGWNQQSKMPWADMVSPSDQYAIANAASAAAAKGRQANATGVAGGFIYDKGQKVGTVGGVSAADAYANANAAAKAKAAAGAVKKTSAARDDSGSPFW